MGLNRDLSGAPHFSDRCPIVGEAQGNHRFRQCFVLGRLDDAPHLQLLRSGAGILHRQGGDPFGTTV
jgi:hypothetical protein